MRRSRFVSLWIILTLLLPALLAVALFPQETGAQTAPGSDEAAITALVEVMADAVHAQDRAAYLDVVDLSDPVFAVEHTRWADEWASEAPVDRFSLSVEDIQVDGDTATGDLTMKWALRQNVSFQVAEYPVLFRRGEDGVWRYAGELWITYETEQFIVRAAPGLEPVAETVLDLLPDIYAHATSSIDHAPAAATEIKLYATPEALIANTLLSLPVIAGWNEPGEALKLVAPTADTEYLQIVLAHEFTHKLTFDMADTTQGNYPWWLAEGIAEYVASEYWGEARLALESDTIRTIWEDGKWVAWDQISDFDTTPVRLWRFVYPQGFAMVSYVTEVYGEARRNDWLSYMAVEMSLDEATQAALGRSFADLDQGFQVWLAEQ
jgi:hypothetical protein